MRRAGQRTWRRCEAGRPGACACAAAGAPSSSAGPAAIEGGSMHVGGLGYTSSPPAAGGSIAGR